MRVTVSKPCMFLSRASPCLVVHLSVCSCVQVLRQGPLVQWTFFSQPSWNDCASCQPVSCGVIGVSCFYLLYSNYVIIIINIMICFSWDILDTPCTHTHMRTQINSHRQNHSWNVKWVQFSGLHQFHAQRLWQLLAKQRKKIVWWENTFKGGNYSPQTKIAIKN